MTQEEWREVDAAVADALELAAADRAAFLRQRLQGREDLIGEAGSLLSYSEGDQPEPIVAPPSTTWIGRQVGPYRITAIAGEGGMGVVWSAERADGQFQRRVAVKFLSTLFPTPASVERFLMERDILALLDHPNIARLLDAGMVGQGYPYLVMEWVDGQRIDEYCRERRLGVAPILELFRQVCLAVEFAHRRLVVHRDLKPSNLLVTAEGQVKLLDFGIAKLGDPGGARQDLTSPLARVLTAEYASPEHLRGEPVTTATDVYSLGVVLYELLTGERPFDFEGKTLGQMVEQAGVAEPAKPSARRPGLAAELDAIVGKALRPQPAERYGSVFEMAADLENFLAGRPVKARPASPLYVAAKFVRRNWLPLGAAALALALIAGSAIVATRQRIQAERRFTQLRQLAGAVIFEFQDNISHLNGTLEVRRLMVKRSLEYLDSLAADAQDDPQLLYELGRGYDRLAQVQGKPSVANLGDFPGALTSVRKAQAALERLRKLRPADFDAACTLGDVLFDVAVIQQRVPGEDYQSTFRQGIAYWENLAKQYPDRERALNGLAGAMFFKPDLERALALYEQLAARGPQNSRFLRDIALVSRTLATQTDRRGDYERSRRLLDRAVEIDSQRVQQQPLDRQARLELSFDLSELATWHEHTNDLPGAVRVFEQVLAIRDDLVRQDDRDEQAKDRLLFVLCQLGRLHDRLHEYAESARYYRRAVDLGEALARGNSRPNQQFAGLLEMAKQSLAAHR